jgi:hypothetical protein
MVKATLKLYKNIPEAHGREILKVFQNVFISSDISKIIF